MPVKQYLRSGNAMVETVPVTLQDAKRFVGEHHRHNRPPVSGLFAIGLNVNGKLSAVAIAGRPVARGLQDGRTVEITRLCVTETEPPRNGCSMLYGACCRAAAALGYRRVITYTLASENAASVRAAGFSLDAELKARPTWNCKARQRVQTDLSGRDVTDLPGLWDESDVFEDDGRCLFCDHLLRDCDCRGCPRCGRRDCVGRKAMQ